MAKLRILQKLQNKIEDFGPLIAFRVGRWEIELFSLNGLFYWAWKESGYDCLWDHWSFGWLLGLSRDTDYLLDLAKEYPKPPPAQAIEEARRAGAASPCCKSQRGVVVFAKNKVVSSGTNHPPTGWSCLNNEECRESCSKICIHAEIDALKKYSGTKPVEVLHLKVENGIGVPSGPPSCVLCSKEMAEDDRVEGIWLWHDTGWKRYGREEFHQLTLENCNLPRKTKTS